jgi:hypothetical protein
MRSFSINYKLLVTFVTVAMLFLLAPQSGYTQEVAVGQAVATVLAALTVTAVQNLDFGGVLQGVTTTVTPTSAAQSGIFQIAGEAVNNREVSMHLQLPEYLWNGAVGSQDRMVIYFQNTDATIDTTNGTPDAPGGGALVGENPHNLPDTGIGGNDGVIRIYLGGSVYPTVDQRSGPYAADIVLTSAYTGD